MSKVNKEVEVTSPTTITTLTKLDVATLTTKSSIIRFLHSKDYTRSMIVKFFKDELNTPIIYQHVRNVLITPIKTQK